MNSERNIQRVVYAAIPKTLNSYRIIGMSTPRNVELKLGMLREHGENQRTAMVVFDAFRCSSTLLAAFSAGADGAMIMEKGICERGTSIPQAQAVCSKLERDLVLGGEFHGKPVPGGVIGNSPIDALSNPELKGRLLHFQSTNFARAFVDLINYARDAQAIADLYVISYLNARATALSINKAAYQRILVVCGGFYDCLALEDMLLGGLLISHLGTPLPQIDDEALTMLATHHAFSHNKTLYESCWTGRVLSTIGKGLDLADIAGVTRFSSTQMDAMRGIVLKVEYVDDVPIIRSWLSPTPITPTASHDHE
jgi:phosphosulfolactate phosphohydrolase-like enzyme